MNAIEEPATPGKTALSVLLAFAYAVVQFLSTITQTIDLPTFYRGQPYLIPSLVPVITPLAHLVENGLQPLESFLWMISLVLLASLFLRGSAFSRAGILILAVVQLVGAVLFYLLILALNVADGSPSGFRDVKTALLHFFFMTIPTILIASLLAFGYGSFMKRRRGM